MKYANATEVLPSELLQQVQRYHEGILWVPSVRGKKAKPGLRQRNERIREAYGRGGSIRDVAREFRLSVTRVWEIVRDLARKPGRIPGINVASSSDGGIGLADAAPRRAIERPHKGGVGADGPGISVGRSHGP